ncbi:MAG: S24 family peptidase [Gilvibacter sp.]
MDVFEIIDRLKSVYDAKNDKQLSDFLDLPQGTISNWKKRNTIPYKEVCKASIDKGISVNWLLTEKGPQVESSNTKRLLSVPHYAVHASAGGGSLIEAEKIEQHLALSREWLAREGINNKDLIGIYAKGDSMEPTIISGDSLLIDREDNVVGSDGSIYVINYEGELFVKRVQKLLDGRIAVTSDNKNHLSIEISKSDLEQLKIIGRVVWFGRKMI